MDEVENQIAEPEIATPETSQQEPVAAAPIEDENKRNWREMRRVKDELERKTKIQEEVIARLMQEKQPSQQQPAQEIDELANISDDDYIPKGQVEKLVQRAEKRAQKMAEDAVNKALEEREKSQFLQKLKTKFSDFDDIVNPETLEILETQDPELAKTIADLGDPYKIGLQSYKYIKSLNLADKVPSSRRAKDVEKKLDQNAKTIQSPLAHEKRPMAQTFMHAGASSTDLYEEMMRFASQAGG